MQNYWSESWGGDGGESFLGMHPRLLVLPRLPARSRRVRVFKKLHGSPGGRPGPAPPPWQSVHSVAHPYFFRRDAHSSRCPPAGIDTEVHAAGATAVLHPLSAPLPPPPERDGLFFCRLLFPSERETPRCRSFLACRPACCNSRTHAARKPAVRPPARSCSSCCPLLCQSPCRSLHQRTSLPCRSWSRPLPLSVVLLCLLSLHAYTVAQVLFLSEVGRCSVSSPPCRYRVSTVVIRG